MAERKRLKKEVRIGLRLTEAERTLFRKLAALEGRTMSSWIRWAALQVAAVKGKQ